MDHGHEHDMMMSPPPSSPSMGHTNMSMQNHNMMMMHMTFYWGKNGEILFSGWPGTRTGMYILALVLVFLLALLVEWLAGSRLVKTGDKGSLSCVLRTLVHALRMGLAYILMLAVMSFNVGVFIVVIVGHALGYLVFGSGNTGSNDPSFPH
ncbi:copper transporter 6-like [Beta vulgaris subsp. vulgaris]|uniref:copper transporter 6-like n=1 Tax=Beta vulgaris subsp. vulgaris TaxID=3555 RepID=UPI00053F9699|nr:copper transporter 6-like [Beta vulgaris subsp. vulgaris]